MMSLTEYEAHRELMAKREAIVNEHGTPPIKKRFREGIKK